MADHQAASGAAATAAALARRNRSRLLTLSNNVSWRLKIYTIYLCIPLNAYFFTILAVLLVMRLAGRAAPNERELPRVLHPHPGSARGPKKIVKRFVFSRVRALEFMSGLKAYICAYKRRRRCGEL